jgi:serine protease inhibitor
METTWSRWLEGFSEVERFTVEMPRFEFDYERSLAEDLKSMGLEVAFSDTDADFSGISPRNTCTSQRCSTRPTSR